MGRMRRRVAVAAVVVAGTALAAAGCSEETVNMGTESDTTAATAATTSADTNSVESTTNPASPLDAPETDLSGVPEVTAMLDGVPQDGMVLGDPDAPVLIAEYIDMKCPVCATASRVVVPDLIKRYVRTGEARIELRPLAFMGPDSTLGATAVIAAADQNRAWHVAEIMLHNQGDPQVTWITSEMVSDVALAAGADADRVTRRAESPTLRRAVAKNDTLAANDGVQGTPTFAISGPNGRSNVVGTDLSMIEKAIADAK